jgi:hypothetical protein
MKTVGNAEELAALAGTEPRLHCRYVSIGGVTLRVAEEQPERLASCPELVPFLTSGESCDIAIRVEWVAGLSPMQGCELFDSGTTWRLYRSDHGFQFDFGARSVGDPQKRLIVDEDFRRATLHMSARFYDQFEAVDPLAYPLDELLIVHRLTQEKAIELHGSGIVRGDGIGNLFVGHSGAGKSTTTQLWTAIEDVVVLSDDRIIVRRDETGHWGMRMFGTPWHGEARYASPASAPLARIFVLEHGLGNQLARLTPAQAVGELFARAFVPFHRHEYVDAALEFLQEVADTIPVYRYSFEPNESAVVKIQRLRD